MGVEAQHRERLGVPFFLGTPTFAPNLFSKGEVMSLVEATRKGNFWGILEEGL